MEEKSNSSDYIIHITYMIDATLYLIRDIILYYSYLRDTCRYMLFLKILRVLITLYVVRTYLYFCNFP